MKLELKHDDKVVDVFEPLVSPLQDITDKVEICLLWVPNKAYYWLINNIAEHRKAYELVQSHDLPEKIDDLADATKSSLYGYLRVTIVAALNRRYDLKLKESIETAEDFTTDVFYKHIGYIADILYGDKTNCLNDLDLEVDTFKDIIETANEFIRKEDQKDLVSGLQASYKTRHKIGKANQILGTIIAETFQIQKHHTNEILYQLEDYSNSYTMITFNELHNQVNKLIGEYLVNKRDLETSISHIAPKLKPQYNLIKFNNGVLDSNTFELIPQTDKPVFTLMETPHDYTPAPYPMITRFLETSLAQDDQKSTAQYIQGVKEWIGYLFTNGNPEQILSFIVGVAGAGKTVITNLIEQIFTKEKISDLKLQDVDKNTHATSDLLCKHLILSRDMHTTKIYNTAFMKQLRGYEALGVNPKGKNPITIPKEEVPKFIGIGNNIPQLPNADEALIETMIIIEFPHKFRHTQKENKDLKHGFPTHEVEGFIFDCIQSYKNKSNEGFILQKDLQVTRKLFQKHEKPLEYLIEKTIKYDLNQENMYEDDNVWVETLREELLKQSKTEGINIPLTNAGTISSQKLLPAIRNVFDLGEDYNSDRINRKRYYPSLKWKK
jgi:phage/plasmid-associated DNA primase